MIRDLLGKAKQNQTINFYNDKLFYVNHKNFVRKSMIKIFKSGIERLRLSVINLARHVDFNFHAKLKNNIKEEK